MGFSSPTHFFKIRIYVLSCLISLHGLINFRTILLSCLSSSIVSRYIHAYYFLPHVHIYISLCVFQNIREQSCFHVFIFLNFVKIRLRFLAMSLFLFEGFIIKENSCLLVYVIPHCFQDRSSNISFLIFFSLFLFVVNF